MARENESANHVSSAPHMIRERLLEAYKQIIFVSDDGFAHDSAYKKANQVLYARIKRLEDSAGELERPRSVRDVIPSSNLARCGGGPYLYNEARERSYTSAAGDVQLHYPCLYKASAIKEPWMLPEVEQIFMHIVLTGSYNFRLYEAELEQLDKVELDETSSCCTGDFHKVNPVIDRLFERAPGKQQPEQVEPDGLGECTPYYFNVNDYEDVLLRKKLLSDAIRELWNKRKLENRDKLLKIYKSSMDNVYVEENHGSYVNSLKSLESEKSLQKLVECITSLNEKVPKTTILITTPASSIHLKDTTSDLLQEETINLLNAQDSSSSRLTRRLYSDVVQGNKYPPSLKQDSPPSKTTRSSLMDESVAHISLDSSSAGLLSPDDTLDCESSASPEGSVSGRKWQDEMSGSTTASSSNVADFGSAGIAHTATSTTTSFQNFFGPLQYVPSTVYNTGGYRMGYTSSFGTQRTPLVQQSTTPQQNHWYFPSYRPTSLCGYGNFLGQLLVPQIQTKHRWSNPHYSRPPATPLYQPLQQQQQQQSWGLQNIYKSTSTQQMPAYTPLFEKNKLKKNTPMKIRSKTPPKPSTKPYPSKILSKPSSDYKLMTRSTSFDAEVSCSASDELEKIALREYQPSSNDLFFSEIERQAKEQYDGNPENSCCPPNKTGCLGGLLAVHYCYHFY